MRRVRQCVAVGFFNNKIKSQKIMKLRKIDKNLYHIERYSTAPQKQCIAIDIIWETLAILSVSFLIWFGLFIAY